MTDIDKARALRLTDQLSRAGWSPNPAGIETNPLRFWIYSCSLERGLRLVTQLGAEFYRDLVAYTGPVKRLVKEFPNPWEAMANALMLFDVETDAGRQDEQLRQHLTMIMAFYARSTQTWGVMQPLNEVAGTHFIILDWLAADWKTTILRPAHIHRAEPIANDELVELQAILIEMHLKNRPGDEPLHARPWR